MTVERLFTFAKRAAVLIPGFDNIKGRKSDLQFVLVTTDIADNSLKKVLDEFQHYPIVQDYDTETIEEHFNLQNCKVLGFAKSDIAKSIYQEMKAKRLNK